MNNSLFQFLLSSHATILYCTFVSQFPWVKFLGVKFLDQILIHTVELPLGKATFLISFSPICISLVINESEHLFIHFLGLLWLACTCFCPVFNHNIHLFFSWSVRDLDIFRKIHLCQMYFGCFLVCCLFFSFVCDTLTISNLELLCYQIFFIIPLMDFGHWSQYWSVSFKSDLIYFCFYKCII